MSCRSACETWVYAHGPDRHSFPQCLGVFQRLPGILCTRHGVSLSRVYNSSCRFLLATNSCLKLSPSTSARQIFSFNGRHNTNQTTRHASILMCVGTSIQTSAPASIAAHLRVRLVDFYSTAVLSRRAMSLKSTCRPFSQAGGKQWSLSPSLCLLCLNMRSFSNREQSLQCAIHSVKQKRLARCAALCRHGHTQTKKKKNHMQDYLAAYFFFFLQQSIWKLHSAKAKLSYLGILW